MRCDTTRSSGITRPARRCLGYLGFLLLLAPACLLAPGCSKIAHAFSERPSPEEVEAFHRGFQRARQFLDVGGMLARFAPDADVRTVSPTGASRTNLEGFRGWYLAEIEAVVAADFVLREHTVDRSGGQATVFNLYLETRTYRGGERRVLRVEERYVVRKRDGRIEIVRYELRLTGGGGLPTSSGTPVTPDRRGSATTALFPGAGGDPPSVLAK